MESERGERGALTGKALFPTDAHLPGPPRPDRLPGDLQRRPGRTDADGDGFSSAQYGGDDCNDADGTVHPGATEAPYDGIDANCSGGSDNDADGDGYDASTVNGATAEGDDCNDNDDTVHPGATELCDGTDNDCDGVIGDISSPATDESDNDGDGFLVCANDCDDTDAASNPGAAERCDEANADEDCDGSTDDGDPSATGQTDWFLDDDGDGYGTANTVSSRCDQPNDYVDDATDCDDGDEGINPDTPWYGDGDEDGWGEDSDVVFQCTQPDGYVLDAGDCLDTDPTLHPGAPESCNDIDDDCDDLVDAEDPDVDPSEALWYRDRDGDGYGDETASVTTCTSEGGYVHVASDCDDYSDTVNPGAAEVCDTQDNNCDGNIDDADPDVTDMITWYADVDGDGFGDIDDRRIACFQPSTYVAADTDCDDGDEAIHPDAQEVCDTIDNDCDTAIDDADASVAPGTTTYTDADGDGFGDTTTATTVCAPPASNVTVEGDCDDSLSAVSPSGTETCATPYDDDCDGDANDLDATSCTTRYDDADGDTYGTPASECRCDADGTYDAAVNTDCDDASAADHPGASETVGNDDDDDCDSAEICYDDADNDGYLDASGATRVSTDTDCDDPEEGTNTDLTTDCDDADAGDHPGATETTGNGDDEDCDGAELCYDDDDDDGYLDAEGDTRMSADADCADANEGSSADPTSDCDDADAGDNPGAAEIVGNADDEDCDGAELCYYDYDDDGYLDAAGGTLEVSDGNCDDAKEGTDTDPTTDCDDHNSDAHPGLVETCDTAYDDDCDGDSNDLSAVSCATRYYDGDGDAYGTTASECRCSAAGDYDALVDTDCDDTDATVNPAEIEICDDGVDNDCDGSADQDYGVCAAELDYATVWGSEMIAITPGSFTMGGGIADSAGEYIDHEVTLTHDFWIGQAELTQGEWAMWTGAADATPSYFSSCGADCPVEQVSWYDAAQYANALSAAEGLTACYLSDGTDLAVAYQTDPYACPGYRMPTEAEWEYAARAAEDTIYSGSNTIGDVGWHISNSGSSTHPVCGLATNAWGLCDMSGNVFEWTGDWHSTSYDGYSTGSASSDPPGPSSGTARVVRGGSWYFTVDYAAVSTRAGGPPGYAYFAVGFRLARSSL